MKKLVLALLLAAILFGCTNVAQQTAANSTKVDAMTVQNNDTVRVEYLGTLDNGAVFDTNIKEEAVKAGFALRPSYDLLEFKVGAHEVISGFENGVIGMKENETKTIKIPAKDAYGERTDELILTTTADKIGGGNVSVGTEVSSSAGRTGVVTAVSDGNVTIDFNHPLAGKDLTFRITVKKIFRQ
jgi:FKBP-type peptidyl-prolyl cis-trans isomerase 2